MAATRCIKASRHGQDKLLEVQTSDQNEKKTKVI